MALKSCTAVQSGSREGCDRQLHRQAGAVQAIITARTQTPAGARTETRGTLSMKDEPPRDWIIEGSSSLYCAGGYTKMTAVNEC